jgi:hypothetical protein
LDVHWDALLRGTGGAKVDDLDAIRSLFDQNDVLGLQVAVDNCATRKEGKRLEQLTCDVLEGTDRDANIPAVLDDGVEVGEEQLEDDADVISVDKRVNKARDAARLRITGILDMPENAGFVKCLLTQPQVLPRNLHRVVRACQVAHLEYLAELAPTQATSDRVDRTFGIDDCVVQRDNKIAMDIVVAVGTGLAWLGEHRTPFARHSEKWNVSQFSEPARSCFQSFLAPLIPAA